MGRQVIGLRRDGLLEERICLAIIPLAEPDFRQNISRFGELGIDLKGVHKLEGRFLDIALVEIFNASLVEFLFPDVGVPVASRKQNPTQENG
jgi:hypothetical protein